MIKKKKQLMCIKDRLVLSDMGENRNVIGRPEIARHTGIS